VFDHRVVPYTGRWQDAGIVDLAEAFNAPLPLAPGSDPVEGAEGIPAGVCVSAIKTARSGRGLVLRLAEMTGQPREFLLRLPGRRYDKAVTTNLLEDELVPMQMAGDALPVRMKPWEVLTVRLE
jgi:alpha-mannosidase